MSLRKCFDLIRLTCFFFKRNFRCVQDDLCAYHEEHDAFPVDGEDPMGEGYVRKKIPKNKL